MTTSAAPPIAYDDRARWLRVRGGLRLACIGIVGAAVCSTARGLLGGVVDGLFEGAGTVGTAVSLVADAAVWGMYAILVVGIGRARSLPDRGAGRFWLSASLVLLVAPALATFGARVAEEAGADGDVVNAFLLPFEWSVYLALLSLATAVRLVALQTGARSVSRNAALARLFLGSHVLAEWLLPAVRIELGPLADWCLGLLGGALAPAGLGLLVWTLWALHRRIDPSAGVAEVFR